MSGAEVIQLRHGTAAQWTGINPVLGAGEMGVETDTGQAKAGDGSTQWNSLLYVGAPLVQTINGFAGDVSSSGSRSSIALKTTLATGVIPKSNGTGLVPAVPGTDYPSVASVTVLQLTPVTVKTSAYTAAAGQLIPCDATSAAFTVTLPTTPADGTLVVVKKIDSTTHAITIAAGGSDVFNKTSGSTSLSLPLQYQAAKLQYYAAPGIWYVISTDAPLGSLDARYLQTVSSLSLTDATTVGKALITAANAAAAATAIGATPTPAASVPAEWDANKNLSANALFPALQSTATATGTTTLTVASAQIQSFTGTLGQTMVLPTTSVPQGVPYTVINMSTGSITVQSSNTNVVWIVAPGTVAVFTSQQATPTTSAHWHTRYVGVNVATGKALTVSNSLTLAGTDATTMTFPGSSDTVATLAATQTLTGKTLTSPVINGTGIANAAIQQGGINNFAPAVFGPTLLTAATPIYVPGSTLSLPATLLNGMQANLTTFVWTLALAKDANGTGAFSIMLYRGTNGTTADTADVTQAVAAASTAVVDSMLVEVQLTILTTGATGSYRWSIVPIARAAAGTGFGVAVGTTGLFSGTVSSVALNTASLKFGLGIQAASGGTMPTITIPLVRALAFNLN